MQRIRYGFIVLAMLLCSVTSAAAEVSIGIRFPNVSIGINLPLYPELVPVPGYPVYYAPRLNANYFFYDGLYWVYQDDNWYASSWYNGPWEFVEPYYVPLFILRIPVRYYRQPPVYFRGWRSDAPPRWGHHWGREWEQRRSGWDRWQRGSSPPLAPLPLYQRQYSGERYPRLEQQQRLHSQQYRYQPRDTVVRERFQRQLEQRAPAPAQRERQEEPRVRSPRQQEDTQRPMMPQQGRPEGIRSQPQPRDGENLQRSAPAQAPPQQRGPAIEEQRRQTEQRSPAPAQRGRQDEPRMISPRQQQDTQRPTPTQQGRPEGIRSQPQPRGGENIQGPPPAQTPPQQRGPAIQEQRPQPGAAQREQPAPRPKSQEQLKKEREQEQEQERNRDRGQRQNRYEERGGGRNY